jgi:hypothetical protein
MLLTHCVVRAASRAAWTAGSNSATKIPIIAMTTSNSISVKPRGFVVRVLVGLCAADRHCIKFRFFISVAILVAGSSPGR